MSEYKLSHLQELEAESIHIIREVAAEPFFCEDYGVRVFVWLRRLLPRERFLSL